HAHVHTQSCAICQQPVVAEKKAKLTHVEFNPFSTHHRGRQQRATSLKLSALLLKKHKEKKSQELPKGPKVGIANMEKLMSLLREPETSNA
uniref:Uncharacterized protein n=1 Tax=Oncorhynchus mykiss TaxID=8022 RepID=A0A8K9Y0W9_ONCMY